MDASPRVRRESETNQHSVDSYLDSFIGKNEPLETPTNQVEIPGSNKGKSELLPSSRTKNDRQRGPVDRTKSNGYIIHQVEPNDTLQGIALQYGVSMPEIKTANKIYAANVIFLPPQLIIPLTEGDYAALVQSRQQEKIQENLQLTEMVKLFCRETGENDSVAFSYLDQTNHDLQRAIEKYKIDTIQKSAKKTRRSSSGEVQENVEVTGLLAANRGYYHNSFGTRASIQRKLSTDRSESPYSISSSIDGPVKQASKRDQERLSQSYQAMFDL